VPFRQLPTSGASSTLRSHDATIRPSDVRYGVISIVTSTGSFWPRLCENSKLR
jgi:hypothetical protein